MKAFILSAFLLSASAFAQQASVVWQNRLVKILGDVANGPPLEPYQGVDPAPAPSWGPRAFIANGKLLNLSARAFVRGSNEVLINGFVVSPGSRIVLIRAVGPSLASFGVPDVLPLPRLELYDSSRKLVATAVAWSATSADTRTELRKTSTTVGAFPLQEGSADAVLLAHLADGPYTCIVSGLNGAQGNVLLEIYAVDSAGGNF